MADSQERTENATDKRMKEVRSKGQLSRSQDVTAWLGVGAAAVMLPVTIARAGDSAADQLFTLRSIAASPDPGHALSALGAGCASLAGSLTPMLIVVALAVLAGAALQGGVHFKKFEVKFDHFNLLKGLKRVLGTQALWQGLKALLKTAVVALVLYVVIQGLMPVLLNAGGLSITALTSAAGDGAASMLEFAVAAGLVLAAADVIVVMRRNRKKTRMTKREVKDENKNTDGDPLIKSQRRSRQLAMSRNRMIAAISGADVVLLNPTHLAVALKYEAGKSAPRVVAKGAGHMAARIRKEADATGVPMIQDVPLARALHASCAIGAEIPLEHYDSVARVLAFVMAMKSRGRFGTGGPPKSGPASTAQPGPAGPAQPGTSRTRISAEGI
ncbi:EscU/YscU/HrcU family type III secretion system export apparatus switch protein [Arthrobacter sp. H14-L1]|uniref:EscU/YscU/HrcU family type III secretion system export apparatus switch protein n=1 Tax=Arthrobacter sp. H14-L1 TaxID=2996697 RepID=UPI00226E41F3|nr:EscU/YscU/HrcU family type III secretion system export apparatus switch protein [Arthrobacter sp. H14-L1]MCY0903398.1 EscU/YscU/HrcU family type III secretion system export apparatus switch protein [Arthrobacter sp. H14-L1]